MGVFRLDSCQLLLKFHHSLPFRGCLHGLQYKLHYAMVKGDNVRLQEEQRTIQYA